MKEISKKNIVLFLIIIATISLGLKLYTVDFAIPPHSDDIGYVLTAVQYNEGDFFSAGANLGEALFLGNIGLESELDKNILSKGQEVYSKLKYSKPVICHTFFSTFN